MTIPPVGRTPRIQYSLIYILSVLFALHNVLIIYVNSSFIEQYVPQTVVGSFYVMGSAIAVLIFLFITRVLRKVGNVKLTVYLTALEILMLIVLGFTTYPALVITAFVLFLVINPLLYLNLDIFSESLIGDDEGSTGGKRGLVLTLMATAAVLGPLAIGPIVGAGDANLQNTYFVSAGIFSLFLVIILTRFRSFTDPEYSNLPVLAAISSFVKDLNIRYALCSQFLLQVCFSWMIIYVPLYLNSVIGLSWSEIGIIISFGLLAYVLLEFPVGYLADNYIGEKEMLAFGFFILALSIALISFITSHNPLVWIAVMFATRIGASLVESTTESFFFKHTKGNDTNYLSFFRLTRPLAFVFGGLLGSASLLYLSFSHIFLVLSVCMITGIFAARQLQDTR